MDIYRINLFAAVVALLFSCNINTTEDPISGLQIDPETINFLYEGGEKIVNITASDAWTLESAGADWCRFYPESGKGNSPVKIVVSENLDRNNGRSTELTVKSGSLSATLTITQDVNTDESSFYINKKSVEVPATGGEFDITVVSEELEYEITIVAGWITELSRSGNRTTGETIRFKADANPSDKNTRTGIVSVCTMDGSCIPITVKQATWPKYAHMNIGYRFTATWCGWCPYMDEVFHNTATGPANRFHFITFHASQGYPLYFEDSDPLCRVYGIQGYPTGVLNGWKEISNNTNISSAVSNVAGSIKQFEEDFRCTTGISVSSSLSGNTLNVEASVKAVPGDYSILAFVIESGIVQAQTLFHTDGSPTETVSNFVHDNIARKTITESPLGDAFTATEEASSFSWSTSLDGSWAKSNLSVAVLVLRAYSESTGSRAKLSYPNYYVANSVIVAAGSSKEMEYAK